MPASQQPTLVRETITALSSASPCLAYLLWFRGIEKIGAAASYLTLLSPVMALLLGIVALSQPLTAMQTSGVALVLRGVYAGRRL